MGRANRPTGQIRLVSNPAMGLVRSERCYFCTPYLGTLVTLKSGISPPSYHSTILRLHDHHPRYRINLFTRPDPSQPWECMTDRLEHTPDTTPRYTLVQLLPGKLYRISTIPRFTKVGTCVIPDGGGCYDS